jgi:hypothetical protein
MPIVPLINGGSALSVRRPRRTINETYAVSSPFPLTLSCNEAGKYRGAPNTVFVNSDRVAITPNTTPPRLSDFGHDYTYNGDVPYGGVLVGYLWIRSVDLNADGMDDLESAASVTLANAIGVMSDNLLTTVGGEIYGIGNIVIAGAGAISMKNFLAGTGSMVSTGSGVMGILSVNKPIAGTGYISQSGSGVVLMKNPLAGTGALGLSGSGGMGMVEASSPYASGTYYFNANGTLTTSAPAITADLNVGGSVGAYANFYVHTSGFFASMGSAAYQTVDAATGGYTGEYPNAVVAFTAKAFTGDGSSSMRLKRQSSLDSPERTFTLPSGKTFQSGSTVTLYGYGARESEGFWNESTEELEPNMCWAYWYYGAGGTRIVVS